MVRPIMLLGVVYLSVAPAAAACPTGWQPFGARCFHAECTPAQWVDAQMDCAAHDGFLATSDSTDTNAFIRALVSLHPQASRGHLPVWIGLNDRGTEGQWQWVADNASIGSFGLPLGQSPWENGEPFDFGGNDEDCVFIGYNDCNGLWHNGQCTFPQSTSSAHRLPYVCELRAGSTRTWGPGNGVGLCNSISFGGGTMCTPRTTALPTASPTTSAAPTSSAPSSFPTIEPTGLVCPAGWSAYGSRCFHGECTPMQWVDAQQNCVLHGGFLATANTSGANAFVRAMIQRGNASGPLPLWIGLNERGQTEDDWRWVQDGQPLGLFGASVGGAFPNPPWSRGEPLDHNGRDEECIFMGLRDCDALWDSGMCSYDPSVLGSHILPSVCELDKTDASWVRRVWGQGSGIGFCAPLTYGFGSDCPAPFSLPSAPPTPSPTALTSQSPTRVPTSRAPSRQPTRSPSRAPIRAPTRVPTRPPSTSLPTRAPTRSPSRGPTRRPTRSPSTAGPRTEGPSVAPTIVPTQLPSLPPTASPTPVPTRIPTRGPSTATPTAEPTVQPSTAPTASPVTSTPTATPTAQPSAPTVEPTPFPSAVAGAAASNVEDGNSTWIIGVVAAVVVCALIGVVIAVRRSSPKTANNRHAVSNPLYALDKPPQSPGCMNRSASVSVVGNNGTVYAVPMATPGRENTYATVHAQGSSSVTQRGPSSNTTGNNNVYYSTPVEYGVFGVKGAQRDTAHPRNAVAKGAAAVSATSGSYDMPLAKATVGVSSKDPLGLGAPAAIYDQPVDYGDARALGPASAQAYVTPTDLHPTGPPTIGYAVPGDLSTEPSSQSPEYVEPATIPAYLTPVPGTAAAQPYTVPTALNQSHEYAEPQAGPQDYAMPGELADQSDQVDTARYDMPIAVSESVPADATYATAMEDSFDAAC